MLKKNKTKTTCHLTCLSSTRQSLFYFTPSDRTYSVLARHIEKCWLTAVHLFLWWDMSMQRYINAAASPPFSLPLLLPCQRQGKWRSKYRCRVHCNSGAPPPFICYDSFCYCWNQTPRREEKASILFNKLPGRVRAEKEALSSALHCTGQAWQSSSWGERRDRNGESTPSGITWYYVIHAGSGIQHHGTEQKANWSAWSLGCSAKICLQRWGLVEEMVEQYSQHLLLKETTSPFELPGSINYMHLLTHSIRINRNNWGAVWQQGDSWTSPSNVTNQLLLLLINHLNQFTEITILYETLPFHCILGQCKLSTFNFVWQNYEFDITLSCRILWREGYSFK